MKCSVKNMSVRYQGCEKNYIDFYSLKLSCAFQDEDIQEFVSVTIF